MMRWLTLVLALISSACVEARYAERGEASDTFIVDTDKSKSPRELIIEGEKAYFNYGETTCNQVKFTYLQNHIEQKAFPTHIVTPLALGLAATGLLFGLTSQDPGFFWPESVPAITPIGFGTAVVFGVTGFIPILFGLGKPEYTVLRTVKSDEYDRQERQCSTATIQLMKNLPWRAWFSTDEKNVVTGTTERTGEFDIRKAAATTLLTTHKLTPQEAVRVEERTTYFLRFSLDGYNEQLEEIELYELPIYGPGARSACSEQCIDAGEARQCRRRESLCRQEPGTDYDLCTNMRMSCLELESPNMAGYEACFDSCVRKRLLEVFNEKKKK